MSNKLWLDCEVLQAKRRDLSVFVACGIFVVTFSAGCMRHAPEEGVYEDLDDSRQVLDRRSCLTGKSEFLPSDAEMLLGELRSFARRVRGRYPLGRMTLTPCGADNAMRSPDYRGYSIAQVLILGDSAEAKLRLRGDLRVVRLSGAIDLGRLEIDGVSFEFDAFHLLSNHIPGPPGSSRPEWIVLELRTSGHPPISTGTKILRLLESHFVGVEVGADIEVGASTTVGSEQQYPFVDLGFRQHQAYGRVFLQCGGHRCAEVLSGDLPDKRKIER